MRIKLIIAMSTDFDRTIDNIKPWIGHEIQRTAVGDPKNVIFSDRAHSATTHPINTGSSIKVVL